MSLQIINDNAYRHLGVYANASKKDIERNKSQFNAYIRVNRPIPELPVDFPNLLPIVNRDLESISRAEGEIAVPKSQLMYGMFWFVNSENIDKDCFQMLSEGKTDLAIDGWKKNGSVSSLHNILICMLILGQYREAILLAYNIYTIHFEEWKKIFSLLSDISSHEVIVTFLDRLYSEVGTEITYINWDGLPKEWEKYIKDKIVLPITEAIEGLLDICKRSNTDSPELRCNDGFTLLEKAVPLLKELENILAPDDIMLVSMEDKVYSEALSCSIASYNIVYDELNNGDATSYRHIAPLCNKLTNMINVKFVSSTVAKRIVENKKTINDKCKDIEKTIYEVQNVLVKCPECGEPSYSIKRYTMFHWVLFLFVAAQWQRTTYTCCPKCMRKHILIDGFTYNILTANVVWMFLILPWSIILFLMSFAKGHSNSVLSEICDDCQKELAERKTWNMYASALIFILASAAIIIFYNFWLDFELLGWIVLTCVVGALSAIGGIVTGPFFRQLCCKRGIGVSK